MGNTKYYIQATHPIANMSVLCGIYEIKCLLSYSMFLSSSVIHVLFFLPSLHSSLLFSVCSRNLFARNKIVESGSSIFFFLSYGLDCFAAYIICPIIANGIFALGRKKSRKWTGSDSMTT